MSGTVGIQESGATNASISVALTVFNEFGRYPWKHIQGPLKSMGKNCLIPARFPALYPIRLRDHCKNHFLWQKID
jgi:hypothetical protein